MQMFLMFYYPVTAFNFFQIFQQIKKFKSELSYNHSQAQHNILN